MPEIHEIAAETYEIAKDETSPEIHDISDSEFEEAANLMLTLCQQNEMERHEEIYRGWKVWPTPETVGTSVNGILGASCEFWDEDEEDDGHRSFASRSRNGLKSFKTSSQCISSDPVCAEHCQEYRI